jgi:glycosyltransferase involved in cell wall biosynthesis
MRFVVYDDQVYEQAGGELWSERTFPLFIAQVGEDLDHLVLLGRSRPADGSRNFRLPAGIDFVALPYYESLASPGAFIRTAAASIRAFWKNLGQADGAWVLGPHPLGVLFALLTLARRRRLVLGVRQEMRSYVRRRHPRSRRLHLVADLLEATWRGLARVSAAVVVGPELTRQYRHAGRLHEMHVSMMRATDLAEPELERERDYGGALRILSVGRLDEEKNPLLLADVLAGLRQGGRDWRLIVCGTGSLEAQLAERLASLGVADAAELRGYVTLDAGLRELYRGAHVFLHVSWTEGVPQVLFEAFAARLPVVATDVGGVATVVGEDAAVLIPAGDAGSAQAAVERIAADAELRLRLAEAGAQRAQAHTLEAEARATARFLAA